MQVIGSTRLHEREPVQMDSYFACVVGPPEVPCSRKTSLLYRQPTSLLKENIPGLPSFKCDAQLSKVSAKCIFSPEITVQVFFFFILASSLSTVLLLFIS